MRNRTYGGVRGRKTKVGRKLLRFPPTRLCLYHSSLVQEHRHYTHRTHKPYDEQVHAVDPDPCCATVGELVSHNTFGHKPSYEQAGGECSEGHQYLCGKEVAEVEQ